MVLALFRDRVGGARNGSKALPRDRYRKNWHHQAQWPGPHRVESATVLGPAANSIDRYKLLDTVAVTPQLSKSMEQYLHMKPSK
eukprot:1244537-Amphidinium_carterae.1